MEEKIINLYNSPLHSFYLYKENAPITIEILKVLQGKNLSVVDAQRILSDAQEILPMLSYFS